MRVVKITFSKREDDFWVINIDGVRSDRIKEKNKHIALMAACRIAHDHNRANMIENEMEYWEVEYVSEDGQLISIMNMPNAG